MCLYYKCGPETRLGRLAKTNLPRPGADAERYHERARRKNRRNSSAISRVFSRTLG